VVGRRDLHVTFLLLIEFNKKLHQVIIDAKNETSARLRLLAEFKDATILSAAKLERPEQFKGWETTKSAENSVFFLKKESEN